MQEPLEKAQRIIRTWRRIFLAFYLTFVLVAVLVVFFSVLMGQFGTPPPPLKGRRIDDQARNVKELLGCQKRLKRLLMGLHQETVSLLLRAQRFDTQPATEWTNWSLDWRYRLRLLDYRCRISELSGKGVSQEIDRMARIHTSLSQLHTSYTRVVVDDFTGRYFDRLRKLKHEVEHVRTLLDRRSSRPHSSGATL